MYCTQCTGTVCYILVSISYLLQIDSGEESESDGGDESQSSFSRDGTSGNGVKGHIELTNKRWCGSLVGDGVISGAGLAL